MANRAPMPAPFLSRAFAAAAAAAVLAGCAVDTVTVRKRVHGPVAEVGVIDAGGGHVRYPLKGPAWLVAKRRKKAFKKMNEHCGGENKFQVTKEFTQDESLTPYVSSEIDAEKLLDNSHYKVETYRHMMYECEKP